MMENIPLGRIVASGDALTAIAECGKTTDELLGRHEKGDWGDLDACEREKNEQSLKRGGRLQSIYSLSHHRRIWIITEADRSATAILFLKGKNPSGG